jgi:hypothetical protein
MTAVPEAELGRPTPGPEYSVGDLLDHLAGPTVACGDAARQAGRPAVPIPAGAPEFDLLLGLLGRDPAWTAP